MKGASGKPRKAPNHGAEISLSDNGKGIPERNRGKIVRSLFHDQRVKLRLWLRTVQHQAFHRRPQRKDWLL